MILERFFTGHDLTGAKDTRTIENPYITDASNGPSDIRQWSEIWPNQTKSGDVT